MSYRPFETPPRQHPLPLHICRESDLFGICVAPTSPPPTPASDRNLESAPRPRLPSQKQISALSVIGGHFPIPPNQQPFPLGIPPNHCSSPRRLPIRPPLSP